MAKLQITGRVIALGQVKEVSSTTGGEPIKKRELYLDMTMYDPYTGDRSDKENKPLLEFGGDKVLAKLEAMNLQKDDVVTISFAIQGTPYKDKQTGKMRVFTAIRCYDIEMVRKAGQAAAQQAAPAPAPAPEPQPQQNDGKKDDLPF